MLLKANLFSTRTRLVLSDNKSYYEAVNITGLDAAIQFYIPVLTLQTKYTIRAKRGSNDLIIPISKHHSLFLGTDITPNMLGEEKIIVTILESGIVMANLEIRGDITIGTIVKSSLLSEKKPLDILPSVGEGETGSEDQE